MLCLSGGYILNLQDNRTIISSNDSMKHNTLTCNTYECYEQFHTMQHAIVHHAQQPNKPAQSNT